MTKRVFRGIFFVSLLTMLASLVLIVGFMYEYYDSQVKNELRAKAYYIAEGIADNEEEYLNNMGIAEDRVTVIDPDGTVIYDNEADVAEMENHGNREEFIQAVEKGTGECSRYSDTLSKKTYYYAIKIDNGQVVRVASSQYTIWILLYCMLQPIAIILLVAIILSAVLAFRISKKIIKPINDLNLDAPDIDESYDEVAPLLRKINTQNRKIAGQMEELRRKQNEFSVISDNMSEGLLVIDKNGEILSHNNSVAAFFSVGDEILTKNILTLNRSENFRSVISKVLNGEHCTKTLVINGQNNEVIANPVFNEDVKIETKSLAGAVILIVDVTEKEEREKLRHEFTSNVSHELKTPLTSIYGVSDMLMSGMVKPEDIQGFAADIHSEAGRLIRLVNDIIKISQLDEDAVPMPKEDVDLYNLSKEVIGQLSETAKERNVSIELVGEHVFINGVKVILHELIYNLCDNAIKYNKDDGQVKISIAKENGITQLAVEDTGIGISKEHLDRVFERFYRVDKSHSKKIGGTGLGLSIVKHAAAYHGGTVDISSTPGVGTKITVTFFDQN